MKFCAVKNYIIAFRLQTQLMTLSAILSYFLYAKHLGIIIACKGFLFVAVSAVFFHMAANSIAEYRDYVNGIDSKESKGASTLPLSYINNTKILYYLGLVCFISGVGFGMEALYLCGKFLLIPGILAGLLVLSYSEGPLKYKYRGLGEVSVFLVFGPILGYSCLYALCGTVKLRNLIISIPIGLLVACVMLANNIRDYKFDLSISNKTLPTILGIKFAYTILFSMVNLAYFILIFIPHVTIWPVYLTYPIMFFSIKYINRHEFFNIFLILQFAFCMSFCIATLL